MSIKVKQHPLGELLAKKLSGIETVPKEYQKKMIKAAIKWHEGNKENAN